MSEINGKIGVDFLPALKRVTQKPHHAQTKKVITALLVSFAAVALGVACVGAKKDAEEEKRNDQKANEKIEAVLREKGIIEDICNRCRGTTEKELKEANFDDITERKDRALQALGDDSRRVMLQCRALGRKNTATLAINHKEENGFWKKDEEIEICPPEKP